MITTYSSFVYDYQISGSNQTFYFDDGGGTVSFDIDVSQYAPSNLAVKVKDGMDGVGTQVYTVSFNAVTRLFTISAPGNFSLLPTTSLENAFNILGFTVDVSGNNSYESDTITGKEYRPQFRLQNFIDFDNNLVPINGVSTRSPDGTTKASDFGTDKLMSCEFPFITDNQISVIEYNPNGISDMRDFMNYAITKAPIEFLADRDVNTTRKCLLESTRSNKSGLGYNPLERLNDGLKDVYRLSGLVFREIN